MAHNFTRSNISTEEFLSAKNLEFLSALAPTVVYLVILMVLGVVGNTIVFLVYYKRFKPSVTRTYILTMSVCDFLNNCLALPSDIFEIRFHYNFDNDGACKFFGIITRFLSLFGASILVAVAVDRYRKICQPTKKQKMPRYVCIELTSCVLLAVCLSVPFGVLRGLQTVKVEEVNLTVVTCSIDDDYVESSLFVIYNHITGVAFIICVAVMSVSYGLIARRTWKLKKRSTLVNEQKKSGQRRFEDMKMDTSSMPPENNTVSEDKSSDHQVACTGREQCSKDSGIFSREESGTSQTIRKEICTGGASIDTAAIQNIQESCPSSSSKHNETDHSPQEGEHRNFGADEINVESADVEQFSACSEATTNTGMQIAALPDPVMTPEPEKETSLASKLKTENQRSFKTAKSPATKTSEIQRQVTFMMFILTAMFVLSYLPYIVMAALRRGKDLYNVDGWVLNLEQIALRSFFINSAINSFVYGFCSAKFRKETHDFICRKSKCTSFKKLKQTVDGMLTAGSW